MIQKLTKWPISMFPQPVNNDKRTWISSKKHTNPVLSLTMRQRQLMLLLIPPNDTILVLFIGRHSGNFEWALIKLALNQSALWDRESNFTSIYVSRNSGLLFLINGLYTVRLTLRPSAMVSRLSSGRSAKRVCTSLISSSRVSISLDNSSWEHTLLLATHTFVQWRYGTRNLSSLL